MKTLLLVCILSFTAQLALAQDSIQKEKKILLVTISPAKDRYTKKKYFMINADKGVQEALAIYALKPMSDLVERSRKGYYLDRKKVVEDLENINKDSIVYNYFESESAALNFVISNGWELQSRHSDISSSGSTTMNPGTLKLDTYTQITSKEKYIFIHTRK